MFSQSCVICLCENTALNAILETDDEISWQQKLRSFTAEDLPDFCKICRICCGELNRAIKFQKQCLEALQRLQVEAFYCDICSKKYKQKASLVAHITRFHSKKRIKTLSSHSDLSFTTVTDNELNPSFQCNIESEFTCHICSSILKSKYRLKRHLNNVHATEKRFACEQCNQKFVNYMYLKAHIKYHSLERPYVCTKCGKRFFSSSDLNHHEKIHANTRAYSCDICAKSFNTASDRTKHQVCVHSDPATWRFSCTVCGRNFPISGNRDAHERTHTPAKPHCCHLCDRAFSTTYTLKRHIKAHSQERRFKCTEKDCEAEYKNSRSLTIHKLKKHADNQGIDFCAGVRSMRRSSSYNCEVCSKSFVSKTKLDKHMCGHTGERPFKCNLCDKTFIDKSYVKQHMKIVHENMT